MHWHRVAMGEGLLSLQGTVFSKCIVGLSMPHWPLLLCGGAAGRELEALARQAGFAKATHYEIAFGLMGVLVATKGA